MSYKSLDLKKYKDRYNSRMYSIARIMSGLKIFQSYSPVFPC